MHKQCLFFIKNEYIWYVGNQTKNIQHEMSRVWLVRFINDTTRSSILDSISISMPQELICAHIEMTSHDRRDVSVGGDPSVTNGFPSQRDNNVVGVSMLWRHHQHCPELSSWDLVFICLCSYTRTCVLHSKNPNLVKSHEITFAHNLFRSYQIVLKFCIEHDSTIAVLWKNFKTKGRLKWM